MYDDDDDDNDDDDACISKRSWVRISLACMSVSNRVVFAQVPVVMSQCINVVTS